MGRGPAASGAWSGRHTPRAPQGRLAGARPDERDGDVGEPHHGHGALLVDARAGGSAAPRTPGRTACPATPCRSAAAGTGWRNSGSWASACGLPAFVDMDRSSPIPVTPSGDEDQIGELNRLGSDYIVFRYGVTANKHDLMESDNAAMRIRYKLQNAEPNTSQLYRKIVQTTQLNRSLTAAVLLGCIYYF